MLCILLLGGCSLDKSSKKYEPFTEGHTGCQEGEINEFGECITSQDNNSLMFGADLSSSVQTEELDGDIKGYIAQPKKEGDYPGVVMIHEWWGLNDNIKEMARLLANQGYVVLAIDLYDAEVADTSEKARELATAVRSNPEDAIVDMKKAVTYLKREHNVSKVGVMGWCFGGGQSLQLSLNQQLDATVIYYGNVIDDVEQLQNITWPVLGIFGAEDTGIPVEEVQNFESALNDLNIENSIHIYEGVGHAFANPSGSRYAEEETKDAWVKTLKFFRENLK